MLILSISLVLSYMIVLATYGFVMYYVYGWYLDREISKVAMVLVIGLLALNIVVDIVKLVWVIQLLSNFV